MLPTTSATGSHLFLTAEVILVSYPQDASSIRGSMSTAVYSMCNQTKQSHKNFASKIFPEISAVCLPVHIEMRVLDKNETITSFYVFEAHCLSSLHGISLQPVWRLFCK